MIRPEYYLISVFWPVNKLYVSGDIDGVDLDELRSKALLKNSDRPQIIDGRLLVDRDVSFLGGLTVLKANGKNFSEHLNNVSSWGFFWEKLKVDD